MAYGISPALPLVVTAADGPYGLTKTIPEALVQNFKNLILTNPGERMMDTEFGVGITKYLFEPQNTFVYNQIQTRMEEQVRRYMPSIKIIEVMFNDARGFSIASTTDSSILYVKIIFRIDPLDITAALLLPVSTGLL
jgi:phage baseplate assembly protein W